MRIGHSSIPSLSQRCFNRVFPLIVVVDRISLFEWLRRLVWWSGLVCAGAVKHAIRPIMQHGQWVETVR